MYNSFSLCGHSTTNWIVARNPIIHIYFYHLSPLPRYPTGSLSQTSTRSISKTLTRKIPNLKNEFVTCKLIGLKLAVKNGGGERGGEWVRAWKEESKVDMEARKRNLKWILVSWGWWEGKRKKPDQELDKRYGKKNIDGFFGSIAANWCSFFIGRNFLFF